MLRNKDESKDLQRKLKQFITQRIRHAYGGVEIKTSDSVYEEMERFGPFIDRGIQPIRPHWLVNDQKRRLNELLYMLIDDKEVNNFFFNGKCFGTGCLSNFQKISPRQFSGLISVITCDSKTDYNGYTLKEKAKNLN